MAASGTNTSSSTTVCEPVARSPSVSHVRSMVTPSACIGIEQWSTCGPSGASSQRMLVTSTSPTSQPLAGPLRALTRKPPSTRRAVPFDADPVGRAGADEDGVVVDHLAEDRLGVHAVVVAPHLGGERGASASTA